MNNSIISKNNRYGQPSANKTLSFCNELADTQDMPSLILSLSKKIPVKGLIFSNYNKSHEITDLSGVYSDENISLKFKQKNIESYRNQNEEEIRKNKTLFSSSIKIVQKYLSENTQSISNHDKFCLEFFQAGLSSHLNKNDDSIKHYTVAIIILKEALNNKEEWAEKINLDRIEKKLRKHVTLSKGALLDVEKGVLLTLEEALYSKSFLDVENYTADEIKALINRLRNHPFFYNILAINALDAVSKDRFNISFIDIVGSRGYVNLKNSIRICLDDHSAYNKNAFNEALQALSHECTHHGLNDIFNNFCNPYSRNDHAAQKKYHEYMRQVLLNLVDAVCPIEILAALGNNIKQINIPHPWSKDLPLEQLVENCFCANGLLSSQENLTSLINAKHFQLPNGQTITRSNTNDEYYIYYVKLLAQGFTAVFGSGYVISSVDAEFFTHATQAILCSRPTELVIIQPLIEYIREHVEPEMIRYIAGHPAKHRISDLTNLTAQRNIGTSPYLNNQPFNNISKSGPDLSSLLARCTEPSSIQNLTNNPAANNTIRSIKSSNRTSNVGYLNSSNARNTLLGVLILIFGIWFSTANYNK